MGRDDASGEAVILSIECPRCGAEIQDIEVGISGRHIRAMWSEWDGGSPEEWPEIEILTELACPEGCVLEPDVLRAMEQAVIDKAANALSDMADYDADESGYED